MTAPKDLPLIRRQVRVAHKAGPMRADIEMTRGIFITGRVYDNATGKGARGGLVHFEPLPENKTPPMEGRDLSAETGDDGRFQLVAIPGLGVLLAQLAGSSFKVRIDGVPINPYKLAEFDAADRPRIKMTTQHGYRAFHGAGGAPKILDFYNACKVVDVKDDGTAMTCDLVLDPGKTLTVKLRDPEGKPLSGAVAAVSPGMLRAVPFKTDTGRIYALDPDNPRPVAFLHVERKLAAVVMLHGDEKVPVTVRLAPAGIITGRPLEMDGQPIAGADLYMNYSSLEGQPLAKSRSRWGLPRTDKEGRFRVEAIVPGLALELGFFKGRQELVPRTLQLGQRLEIKPLQSGQMLDLGDIRTKP